ncbi:hypothetical protein D3C79_989170 [compost metagenome]
MGDEDGVTGGQRIGCPVFHAQHRVADRQEVEPGMPGFGSEAQAEGRARLDTPVVDTAQAHAAQQLVDEIGREGKWVFRHYPGVLVKKLSF